jgi:serine/threonine protein kinase
MGAIFEAEHLATERRVALKLLFPHIMSVASARQKFELEAKVSARVNSPYIVEVLDAGFDEASKSPYLVMELLEGQTLAARVREHGPLAPDEALRLLEQVAAGLDAAHGYKEAGGAPKPIVHRDLKPENLFLARQHDGSVLAKILDYGIAKVLGDTAHISQEVRGTPLFMAFEQITAGVLSPQTDVWALGLIAHYVLTGTRYWRSAERQGASVQSLFAEILTLPLEAPSLRLRESNPDVFLPPAFDAWLLRCIDREPSQRFPTAGAAIEALGRVYERAPRVAARPSVPIARSSEKTQTFIAADPAVRAAAAAPSPPTSASAAAVGSVPALSATKHRRSLPSRMMTSPLHWAAVGAAGGAIVLGAIVWLATRAVGPSREAPVVHEPASSVQSARPAPASLPGPSTLPRASAGEPSPPEPSPSPEVSAPRVRIAPLEETSPGVKPGSGSPEAAAGDRAVGSVASSGGAAAGGAAPRGMSGAAAAAGASRAGTGEARTGSGSPEAARGAAAAGARSAGAASPGARSPASAPRAPAGSGSGPIVTPVLAAPSSGGAAAGGAGAASAAAATPPAPQTPPNEAPKRPRKPAAASEAYKTR